MLTNFVNIKSERGKNNMSTETPILRFPTVCPQCSKESLSALPLSVITAALTNGSKLRLRAGCCYAVTWDATEAEREQIREYWLSTTMDEEHPPEQQQAEVV
jgi:hypothetical protein